MVGKRSSPVSQTEILKTVLKTNELYACISAGNESHEEKVWKRRGEIS